MKDSPTIDALIAELEAYANDETQPSVGKVREWHDKLLFIRCGLVAHIYTMEELLAQARLERDGGP